MPRKYGMKLDKCVFDEPDEDMEWETVWTKTGLSLVEVYDIFKTYAEKHPDMNNGIPDEPGIPDISSMCFIENGVEYSINVF